VFNTNLILPPFLPFFTDSISNEAFVLVDLYIIDVFSWLHGYEEVFDAVRFNFSKEET